MQRRLIFAALLLGPLPAAANQPPGAQPTLGLVALLAALPLLTAVAGGYAILRATGSAPSRWRLPAGIAALVFAAMHEGNAFLVTGIVALLAVVRAGQLLRFGIRARRPKKERDSALASARPARLLGGGAALLLVASAIAGNAAAFLGFRPDDDRVEDELARLVARELAWGFRHAGEDGLPRFEAPLPGSGISFPGAQFPALSASYSATFTLGPDARSFQVTAAPARMPFFPYNLLVTLPSFYADETGTLRAIRVHDDLVRCPPEGPAIRKVRPDEIQQADRRLDSEPL